MKIEIRIVKTFLEDFYPFDLSFDGRWFSRNEINYHRRMVKWK